MTAKLTLRLDERLIAAAKEHAHAHGRSVSALVADYFAQLATNPPHPIPMPHAPITHRLRGALRGATVTEDDAKAHRAAKQQ
ncbi:MAG: hypothetical protein RLZZ612_461 [Pseudomonadota bacterium]|jgi:hypothetical protein